MHSTSIVQPPADDLAALDRVVGILAELVRRRRGAQVQTSGPLASRLVEGKSQRIRAGSYEK